MKPTPTATPAPVRVTWDQVAAFRLSRHHLAERAPARALVSVLGAMGGAQAQLLSAAHLALWARVRDLRPEDIHAADRARTFVKAWCMRRTLHLVPSQDLAVFIRGAARRAEREVRWLLGRGVSERAVEELIGTALGALDRPLSGPELVGRVSQSLGVPVRKARWGGWGSRAKVPGVTVGRVALPVRYLLHVVAARGVVCSGPSRGTEPTFVRADAWVPRWRDMPSEAAEDELLRRYLRAYGPATAADFARWTGMTLSEARVIWRRQEAELVPVSVEGWAAAIFRDDLRKLAARRSEPLPVRLLPYFDTYLLGHEARGHLVAVRHHKTVYSTAGWIAPVVLVDGRVAGVWAHARERHRLVVRVTRFGAVSGRTAAGIRDEAERLAGFLGGGDAQVQIL
ncbi:MAG TPA: winged helix DNA-binding domain-containing protein [bacterium]|nr:winged helix DNA-binding domain-containing protein [bacterium]